MVDIFSASAVCNFSVEGQHRERVMVSDTRKREKDCCYGNTFCLLRALIGSLSAQVTVAVALGFAVQSLE